MTTSAYNLLKLEVVILRRWPELLSYLNGCGAPPAPQALRNRRSVIKPCFQGNEWWSKSSCGFSMFLLGHVINGRAVQSLSTGVKLICTLPPALFETSLDHFCFRLLLQCENQSTGDNTASDYSRSYLAGPST